MRDTVQGRLYPEAKRRETKRRKAKRGARAAAALLVSTLLLLAAACLPKSGTTSHKGGERNITLYAFSVMKEVMDKAILPGFAAKWKQEHGEDVKFTSSYAGSETITNQILQGVGAHVGIFSIERDVERLAQKGLVTSNWKATPFGSVVNKTPFVILVRKGNPKGIHDFADLAKPGVRLIHPDPDGSGGAQWSILAIYGSELKKSQAESGGVDQARALQLLKSVWGRVISTPGSAREARTTFETGYGDALITYELEGLMMKQAGSDIEIVVPRSTIFSEHPAIVIDKNVTPEERPLIDAFMQYLWSDEAQQAFVKYHFRSITHDEFNDAHKEFAHIELPFTVDELFGGWQHAYPEVIDGVWRKQVKKK
ncbi:MAG: sulfate/thiosulfate transport system substrate-binding protein [Acidobacteriota bacterium]|jgi:sulfate transport system substrate-binding protein|nr:sulfate/thiosulfate transport system substrate-binding protein [Acidobacteriota bacterium]